MRIISDFHDYYDAVQAAGQDQTLIYHRKPEEVEVRNYPFPALWTHFLMGDDYVTHQVPPELLLQQHVIGFCGRIYPALRLIHAASKTSAVCFSVEEVDGFFTARFRQQVIDRYRNGDPAKKRWWHKERIPRNEYGTYFSECAAKKDAFAAMFLEKRCPVFVGTVTRLWRRRSENQGKIVYNASLKDLEFFRVFDTYCAFQEIVMFLGGLAVPLKEIPNVPDKIMVGVKGFDEWSFRKPPQKKR